MKKEYTEERVRSAIHEWKDLLGFSHWKINVSFSDSLSQSEFSTDQGEPAMSISPEYTRDLAVLEVNRKMLQEPPTSLNYYIAHELCHLYTSRSYKQVEQMSFRVDDKGERIEDDAVLLMLNALHDSLELATDRMARTVCRLHGVVPSLRVNDVM